ncbi:nuclear transport factor 2 family protein [Pedobacter sp.]|uniref:nuclear transport factor 2 family protein n=1 Tax=Pedobacter sp. TaxID=1411316 RepID=UPI003D7F4118
MIKKYLMAMLLIVTGFVVQAQTSMVLIADAKAETKIAAAVEKLRVAMLSGVRKDLESVLSDDLAYGHSSGKIETKAEFIEAIVSRTSDFKSIDLEDQKINVQGKLAIVRHILTGETNDGGKKGNVRLGIVLVFKQVNNQWLLCSRNAFRVAA